MTTREQWLMEAAEYFRPQFDKQEFPLPEMIRISTGFAKRQSANAIGVCYNSKAAEDGIHQIFIAPTIKEPVKVLATTLHELIHAADDGKSGHKGDFKRVAQAMGLQGKMTATIPGDDLTMELEGLAVQLGEYPHGLLLPSQGGTGSGPIGKQSTRMLKMTAECCGYIARTTAKWIEFGLPSCPCGNEMVLEIR